MRASPTVPVAIIGLEAPKTFKIVHTKKRGGKKDISSIHDHSPMELEEFIKTTLVNISNGMRQANLQLASQEDKTLGKDFSSTFVIEALNREKGQGYIAFDIAVTVSHESKKAGETGLKIAIASLGGEIGDVKTQEHISRIKFHVLPHRTVS